MSTTVQELEGPKLLHKVPTKSLGQLLYECAKKHAGKICQIDGSTEVTETYKSVLLRSTRVAINMKNKGINHEDVIAFCCGNTSNTIIPMLAALYLGAKVTSLEPTMSISQMQELLCLVHPRMIFVEEESVNLIENSLMEADLHAEIIVYIENTFSYTSLDQLEFEHIDEKKFKPSVVDLDEVAIISFTSGTTGVAKAICHTHKSCLYLGLTSIDNDWGDAVLHSTSFHWIISYIVLMYSFLRGSRRIFLSTFEPESVFEIIQQHQVSTLTLCQSHINYFCAFKNPGTFDISSLRIVQCVGPLLSQQYHKISQTFQNSCVASMYVMTEVGIISLFQPTEHKDLILAKPQSSGKPYRDMKIKIVDFDSENMLGPDEEGEIRIKSPCMFQGYYQANGSFFFDADGYYRTGDVGYYDKEGCLYVLDRFCDVFMYKNRYIIPSNIEQVLLEHPEVVEAVVFGVPFGGDGEVPKACVVLKQDSEVTVGEIEEFVNGRVSEDERLRGGVVLIGSLKKTFTGKYKRKEMRHLHHLGSNKMNVVKQKK